MTKSESISPWTKQWVIYFLPCYWLFLVVLMFHLQSGQELVWGGLNYSHIQRGSISCLAGSDINWKEKPTCKQRETATFAPSSTVFFSSDQHGHLHLPARADAQICRVVCPRPIRGVNPGHSCPPPGVFPGQGSYQHKPGSEDHHRY